MQRYSSTFILLSLVGFLCSTAAAQNYDVVIYGGTSAAVTAAIQAKKMGKSVIVVSPDKHLGGLTSGGLGLTDSGKTASVGGLSRQFYERVYAEYQKDETWRWQKQSEYTNVGQGTKAMLHNEKTMWVFEPHVAEAVFEKWVAENQITIVRNAFLDREKGVRKNGTRIISITALDGKTYEGKMFIDATYEGDLMAAAGVKYTVGREANSEYGETYNGNQFDKIKHHHFTKPVDPYIVPGDPASGLLKYIGNSKEGVSGEADKRVQAYCYRLCMTDHEPNRVPFPKPEGYDPADYELLLRVLQSQEPKEYGWVFNKFDRIPNHKTDTNNHGAFSMDFIGMNYDYPDATYEKRKEIEAAHRNYQLGWCYFLANDGRVPAELRQRVNKWGLAKDEFLDNGHFSHQLYVREARRMVGEYVMTQHNCQNTVVCPKPVGMGSYGLDSHNVRRYVTDKGTVQNEGDIQIGLKAPYNIDYGSLVPKRGECTNLLVPVCVSCTHIAFGSIRMEPVFMILGQSAATAAVFAIEEGIDIQKVNYDKLKERLIADGQRLAFTNSNEKKLDGIVVDNTDAKLIGNWEVSSVLSGYVGANYLHDNNEGKGNKSVEFTFKIDQPGKYDVRIAYTANQNRANNVPVQIVHKEGKSTVEMNQTKEPAIDNLLFSAGVFSFGKTAVITISNRNTTGYVVVDTVQLLPIKTSE